jgi:transposase
VKQKKKPVTRFSHVQKIFEAYIILDWHEGKSYDETQALRKVSRRVVAKWRGRFLKHRMDGLVDATRSGKPVVITEVQKNKVIHLACSKPDKGYSNWSQQRIGEQIGISQSKVNKILKEHDLKPHKVDYWCGKSTDPEFESKMLNIVGLYMSPPENAIVLCIDEKTQIQALDRTQPELPLRHGNPKRLTATYKRNGVVNLIASLAVHQGEVVAETMESNNAVNFFGFLKKLKRKYAGKKITHYRRQPFSSQTRKRKTMGSKKQTSRITSYTDIFIMA